MIFRGHHLVAALIVASLGGCTTPSPTAESAGEAEVPGAGHRPPAGQTDAVPIKALDWHGRGLPGIRFLFAGVESLPTNDAGVTGLAVPDTIAGEALELELPPDLLEEWILADSMVAPPAGPKEEPAEVLLMRRAELRELAAGARDAVGQASSPGEEISEPRRRRILVEHAAGRGLTEEQLATATLAFGEIEDPLDRGIAAYLSGEYAGAETLLGEVAAEGGPGSVESLRYLGAVQYAQGKYSDAVTSLRQAVAVRENDALLLCWLGMALHETARWGEAEEIGRRFLEITLSENGQGHPTTATAMNNLARLFQATNRLSEAEPLFRGALAIAEASYMPDHPGVAIRLNNLAQLLQVRNRLAESEPLMRRALAIAEANYGTDHPDVARYLNNLAQLLQAGSRLSESESLMRRALAIDEAGYGPKHPDVARDLNNLAQLLQAMNRLPESEPLMRRALAIVESGYKPDHPRIAIVLNNLAQLLQAMNRLAEAEPLMRRALVILEAGLGEDHLYVANQLNNLARLLQVMNRLPEAEPLMRRGLAILEADLGEDHPDTGKARDDLTALLSAIAGKPTPVRVR